MSLGFIKADILSLTTACTKYFKGEEYKKLCIRIICWQRKFLPNIRQFVIDLSPQTGKFMCLLKKNPVECNSDVSLFINPNKFLFEIYLISLK